MNLKLCEELGEAAKERISYLVDLAKSDALAAIGDDQAAMAAIDRTWPCLPKRRSAVW